MKTKAKVSILGEWLLHNELSLEELVSFAEHQHGADKATCIESIADATKKRPTLANEHLLVYVTGTLTDAEPRVKWESAKVIGNIAKLFPEQVDRSIANLLQNTTNAGTVVRWATAYALAEILKLKTANYSELQLVIEKCCEDEEDNGVKRKYLDALKKLKT